MIHRSLLILALTLALITPAFAATRYLTLSNGTGFFVTKDGYIVTNAHVVKACTSLVRATGVITTDADIIARDDEHDLAILKARVYAPSFARLRYDDNGIRPKDATVVMGYPGPAGAQGHVSFVKSHIIAPSGPGGESHWLQFENAAQKGNSGGPLLDLSGNVVGVITGKTQTFRVNKAGGSTPVKISEADVAVNLYTLKNFLNRNRVRFQTSTSNLLFFSDARLQQDAKNFIVQLKCVTGEAVR
jgi:uncharacterized protein